MATFVVSCGFAAGGGFATRTPQRWLASVRRADAARGLHRPAPPGGWPGFAWLAPLRCRGVGGAWTGRSPMAAPPSRPSGASWGESPVGAGGGRERPRGPDRQGRDRSSRRASPEM